MPDEPSAPEIPEVPDEPSAPETPEVPDEPPIPDVPDVPDEPEFGITANSQSIVSPEVGLHCVPDWYVTPNSQYIPASFTESTTQFVTFEPPIPPLVVILLPTPIVANCEE